jgi:hypothetical protein
MAHIFLEISGIDPGLKTPADLSHVLRDSKETTYSITPELVHWIKGAIAFRDGQLMPDFKNCCFAFGDGKEFIEFDGKGKIKPLSRRHLTGTRSQVSLCVKHGLKTKKCTTRRLCSLLKSSSKDLPMSTSEEFTVTCCLISNWIPLTPQRRPLTLNPRK